MPQRLLRAAHSLTPGSGWSPSPQAPFETSRACIDATLAPDKLIQRLRIRLVGGRVPQAVLDRYRSRGGAQSRGGALRAHAFGARRGAQAARCYRPASPAHPLAIRPVGLSARTAVVHSDGALTLRVVRWRPGRLSCGHPARLIIDGPVPGTRNALVPWMSRCRGRSRKCRGGRARP